MEKKKLFSQRIYWKICRLSYLRQQTMQTGHITVFFENIIFSIQYNGCGHIQWHEEWRSQKVVIQAHHVAIWIQAMAKPGQEPWQCKQRSNGRSTKILLNARDLQDMQEFYYYCQAYRSKYSHNLALSFRIIGYRNISLRCVGSIVSCMHSTKWLVDKISMTWKATSSPTTNKNVTATSW